MLVGEHIKGEIMPYINVFLINQYFTFSFLTFLRVAHGRKHLLHKWLQFTLILG